VAKFLLRATYTVDGIKGVLKEGGSARRAAAQKAVESGGGRMEAFYYAFGEDDAYVIVDVADNAAAAAVSMTIGATGAVRVRTIALVTPEEIDKAAKASVSYRAPGA
jgi:uncharacterized protein with GYD domain